MNDIDSAPAGLEDLYASYGKTSDKEINKLLGRISLVCLANKGVGSTYGYYGFADSSMDSIKKNPRGVSHTWDPKPGKLIKKPLKAFKKLKFLVKSSSRFFFKPDIGEVFDAMTECDKKRAKAIHTLTGESACVNGDGDHFICYADLLE